MFGIEGAGLRQVLLKTSRRRWNIAKRYVRGIRSPWAPLSYVNDMLYVRREKRNGPDTVGCFLPTEHISETLSFEFSLEHEPVCGERPIVSLDVDSTCKSG
jgi:hypothetical protein